MDDFKWVLDIMFSISDEFKEATTKYDVNNDKDMRWFLELLINDLGGHRLCKTSTFVRTNKM